MKRDSALLKRNNEATYAELERMIYRLCWIATIRWGGEWEDYLEVANWVYLRAWRAATDPDYPNPFDSSKASFSTYVYNGVRRALLNFHFRRPRREACETDLRGGGDGPTLADVRGRDERPIARLIRELGEDGRTVVSLLVDRPGRLSRVERVAERPASGSVTPEAVRRLLGQHLREALGWSNGRVVDAFAEVREGMA